MVHCWGNTAARVVFFSSSVALSVLRAEDEIISSIKPPGLASDPDDESVLEDT